MQTGDSASDMISESELSERKAEEFMNDSVPIKGSTKEYKWKIKWRNIFMFLYIHYAAIYGLLCIHLVSKWTLIWFFAVYVFSAIGVTAGAHRLWSHRSYKAKWPLRLLLMILQTTAYQSHIYAWVRNHRMHHKYSDTDADPHNPRRGFFFSHIGWLLIHKHPYVIKKGPTIDLSDLKQDPFVAFQKKYYVYLMLLLCFIVPTITPWWVWNESLWYSWHCNITRYCVNIHATLLVNSVAHRWGMRPYDKSITPVENAIVAFLVVGEGWHNYHHVFPWDYKTSEFGNYTLNITTAFIDLFTFVGWAYDKKTASPDIVKKRILRNEKETKRVVHAVDMQSEHIKI